MKFGLTFGVGVGLILLASLLAAVVPTCIYLYVEPRGRRLWPREGDSPSSRRAPPLVRVAAWLSFLLGELAIPWLAVPVACGVLLYLQAKLGLWRPIGIGVTAACGVMGVFQTLLALRLIPLGVRLLMRNAPVSVLAGSRARFAALANVALLGGAYGLWSVAHVPGVVNPWLSAALGWAALRPVMVYGVACLVHSLVLWQCGTRWATPVETKGEGR
jgi:hypothetical protein